MKIYKNKMYNISEFVTQKNGNIDIYDGGRMSGEEIREIIHSAKYDADMDLYIMKRAKRYFYIKEA